MSDTRQRKEVIEIFLSYAHEDEVYRQKLEGWFRGPERDGIVRLWFDRKIPPGNPWEAEIDEHLETAHVILAMLTQAFQASAYCSDTEARRAIDRHHKKQAHYIPLLVEEILDYVGSSLGDVQHIPAKPAIMQHENPDEILREVVKIVIDRAVKLRDERQLKAPSIWRFQRRVETFIGRSELLETLRRTFRRMEGAEGTRCQMVVGPGGLGKSTLALEYAHLHHADYDYGWWINAEQPEARDSGVAGIAADLGLESGDQVAALLAVREWLGRESTKRCLLVFDSATEPTAIRALLPPRHRVDVLITSRLHEWSDLGLTHNLGRLSESEAVRYVHSEVTTRETTKAKELWELTKGEPLSLMEAARSIKARDITIGEYVYELREKLARGDDD